MSPAASSGVLERLTALGLSLPVPPTPRGAFKLFSRAGNLVFLAGQICERDGEVPYTGRLGEDIDLDVARKAAELCALNLLASLNEACEGDLDRVVACHRLGGFVYAVPGYAFVPKVVDGASELIHALFGEAGRHARTAVGVATLPAGATVEVEGIFEIA
ncbi:RidA family protein [Acuticoccus mangrovi]|uniref:RidA family protein n=1 Tax=Acuticoccus mangrovi TaxID=2796142 RepID=A0A934IKN7_9HYPH|nr:RidA family protein [Acuticoccus mangrovi]MBJ3778263.1 RidA family protein [Acuticoccus mangrovi]